MKYNGCEVSFKITIETKSTITSEHYFFYNFYLFILNDFKFEKT